MISLQRFLPGYSILGTKLPIRVLATSGLTFNVNIKTIGLLYKYAKFWYIVQNLRKKEVPISVKYNLSPIHLWLKLPNQRCLAN